MIDFNKDVMPLKNKLYRLALRLLHNHEEAQDVTQETLIRLWTRRDNLATPADAETFGLTICHNLALDTLAKAGRDNEEINSQQDLIASDDAETPSSHAETNDRRNILQQAINRLPQRQQTIVQLRDIEGKSYKEIATILTLTEQQVKVTLFRARQTLKEECKKIEHYGL